MARITGKKRLFIKGKNSHVHYCIVLRNKRGVSIKPSNVIVNIKETILGLPEIVLSTNTVYSSDSLLIVIAALTNVAKVIGKMFTCDIKKKHAIVLIALWKEYLPQNNQMYCIPVDEGYELSKKCCEAYGEKKISMKQYQKTLDDLVKMKCIQILDDKIYLRESITFLDYGIRSIRQLKRRYTVS